MEIIDLNVWGGRAVAAYGSQGLTAEVLSRTDAVQVTVLRVTAGGVIGRHSAEVDQILLVISGRGSVRSGDGPWEPVEAGKAARWRAGEEHETRADEDLTAYVVESSNLISSVI